MPWNEVESHNTKHHVHSFIHSGHFYSAPSSPLLLRGAPDYSTDTVSEFHAEAHRQLQVKDLSKVPTWRLERESNPRPSGWKSSSQPRRHHVPQQDLALNLQCIVTLCIPLWSCAVLSNPMWSYVALCDPMWFYAVLCFLLWLSFAASSQPYFITGDTSLGALLIGWFV